MLGLSTRRRLRWNSPRDEELGSSIPPLLDERSHPDFRKAFGILSREATELQVAVTRVRLSGVDLREDELDGIRLLRILVGEVNAVVLGSEADAIQADPRRAENLHTLLRLFRDGRLRVRSAPLAGWSPDFTVFHMHPRGPTGVLMGCHWFQRPYPHRGPAFASFHGPREARRAAGRFDELWAGAHEIGAAVQNILQGAVNRGGREGQDGQ